MNHKRRRPKHQRAGCLLCKPQKDERAPKPESGHMADMAAIADSGTEPWLHDAELRLIAHDAGCCPSCPDDAD